MLERYRVGLIAGGLILLQFAFAYLMQPTELSAKREGPSEVSHTSSSYHASYDPVEGVYFSSRRERESEGAAAPADQDRADNQYRPLNTQEADLLAQRQMAHWTLWIAAFTASGLVAIILSLDEAREVTRVTREIGYGQLRPYVGFQGIKVTKLDFGWLCEPTWKNYGQTPALRVVQNMGWEEVPAEPDELFEYPDKEEAPVSLQMPPGRSVPVYGPRLTHETLLRMGQSGVKLHIWGWVEYSDGMEPKVRHRTEFCASFFTNRLRDRHTITMVGPHNGADSECLKKPHT